MKLRNVKSSEGGVLVVTIVICALVGLMLTAYLGMVSSQHNFTQRSQVWNNAIPMCEAGVEEAMAHINHINTTSNFGINGWTSTTTGFTKPRDLNGGRCLMEIDRSYPPVITVRGQLREPLGSANVVRAVRVKTKINHRFPDMILAKGAVDLGGGARMDSFNSTNALESGPGGIYDPTRATDRASVVTTSRIPGEFLVGGSTIYGSVGTGPGGTVGIANNGNVGSTAFNDNPAYDGQIEAGHVRDDVNVYIPDGMLPIPWGPVWPMSSGFIGLTNFTWVLDSHDYNVASMNLSGSQKLGVIGHARLFVSGTFRIQGSAIIYIAPGASLELYARGDVDLSGGGVWNYPGQAKNFSIIGLNTCTSVSYSGSATFCGTIYAPYADVKMTGTSQAIGAFVGKTFKLSGTMDFHYDEALQGNPREGRFLVAAWQEIPL